MPPELNHSVAHLPFSAWLQPLATVASALIVLLGVWATFRHNRQRLKTEQLEKRAKERESISQQLYGSFAAAAHQCIQSMAEYGNAFVLHEEFVPAIAAFDKIPEEQAKGELLVHRNEAWVHVRARFADLASAYSRILIDEDDPTRLRMLTETYDKMRRLDFRKIKSETEAHIQALRAFCADIGVSLNVRYTLEKSLAERGELPSRVLPTGSARPASVTQDSASFPL